MDIFTDDGRRELAVYTVKSSRIGIYGPWSKDRVRITYVDTDLECVDLARRLAIECLRAGARTTILPTNASFERDCLEAIPEELLVAMDPLAREVSKATTCKIFVGMEEDPNSLKGIESKAALGAENSKIIREEYDKRSGRFLYIGFPIAHAAPAYGLSAAQLRHAFESAFRGAVSPVTKALCNYYRIKLQGSRIRIFDCNGTDLRMERGSRPILMDDGYISDEDIAIGDVAGNLPSGETFLSPIEESVTGRIVFERKNVIPDFGEVEGLVWDFKEGRIAGFDARKGRDRFAAFLDAHTGGKDVFAELGVGCNIGAQYTGGIIIIDEKEAWMDPMKESDPKPCDIEDTIHTAIGGNTGTYGGKNSASNHWDVIRPMKGTTVTVDGEVIMFDGHPTDEKLFYQCLEEAA